jgi:plastocyanin
MSARSLRRVAAATAALLVGALLVAGLSGCGAPPNTVSIHDLAFDPAKLTVPVGTTVTWVNNEETAHIIQTADFGVQGKSQVGQFASRPLNPGESYTHTFDAAGTYDYIDPLQGYMSGTVVVQ